MPQHKWVKQITRENTLLDRSIRTVAYAQSVHELGKAKMARCPIVGFGKITTFYYDPVDYAQQQTIILSEFKQLGEKGLLRPILRYLEQGYRWGMQFHKRQLSNAELADYFQGSLIHHAHARGAIVYSYWGEPMVTERLKMLLRKKVSGPDVDSTVSILSAPKIIHGLLRVLYHPKRSVADKKAALIRTLHLTEKEKNLVRILSWCTLLYELAERVASFLYDELLQKLKQTNGSQFEKLMWYDPENLMRYFHGHTLSLLELQRRQQCYILQMRQNTLTVTSGTNAKKRYKKEFAEKKPSASIREMRGVIACNGVARGKVRIIITADDQKKMRKGDILISTMTTPRLMTAMKKAAAIVTDEGGLTAHAAIVSREFNIPCIVGTKHATQVLKDGDLVEVDANKGIVTKL